MSTKLITQADVDSIVKRAKELGASEGLTHKQGLFHLDSYEKPWTIETLAHVLVNGWHGKYELIYAQQAALEFMEGKNTSAEQYIENLCKAAGVDSSQFPAWVFRKASPYESDKAKDALIEKAREIVEDNLNWGKECHCKGTVQTAEEWLASYAIQKSERSQ